MILLSGARQHFRQKPERAQYCQSTKDIQSSLPSMKSEVTCKSIVYVQDATELTQQADMVSAHHCSWQRHQNQLLAAAPPAAAAAAAGDISMRVGTLCIIPYKLHCQEAVCTILCETFKPHESNVVYCGINGQYVCGTCS